jgi:Ca2+-transporting ATPase
VAAQLLWINLVTSGLQDISLALEPGEKGISKRPPRNPKEGIMSRLMLERTLLVGLLISAGVLYNFLSSLNSGDSMEKARTIAITTVVFFQFFQAWNSRSLQESIFRMNPFGNPYLFFAVAAAFIAHLMVLYIPGLQWIFRTVPLNGGEWLRIAAVTATVVIAVELHKWLKRRRSV